MQLRGVLRSQIHILSAIPTFQTFNPNSFKNNNPTPYQRNLSNTNLTNPIKINYLPRNSSVHLTSTPTHQTTMQTYNNSICLHKVSPNTNWNNHSIINNHNNTHRITKIISMLYRLIKQTRKPLLNKMLTDQTAWKVRGRIILKAGMIKLSLRQVLRPSILFYRSK